MCACKANRTHDNPIHVHTTLTELKFGFDENLHMGVVHTYGRRVSRCKVRASPYVTSAAEVANDQHLPGLPGQASTTPSSPFSRLRPEAV